MANNITDADFGEKIGESKGVSIVDFWAPWCAPCLVLGPELEKLAEKLDDVMVYKLNVDENRGIASMFRIMSIPTVIWFKDGKAVDSILGAVPYDTLETKTLNVLSEK